MAIEITDIKQNTNSSGTQIIEIPEHLKIEDEKVYLKKVDNTIYVIPYNNPWQSLLQSVHEFSEDFLNDRNEPDQQKREPLDWRSLSLIQTSVSILSKKTRTGI